MPSPAKPTDTAALREKANLYYGHDSNKADDATQEIVNAVEPLCAEVEALRVSHAELEAENENLRRKMNRANHQLAQHMDAQVDLANERDEARADLAQARRERDEAQKEATFNHEAANTAKSEAYDARASADRLHKENGDMCEELAAAKDERDEARAQVAKLTEERARVSTDQVDDALSDLYGIEGYDKERCDAIDVVASRLAALEKENAELRGRINDSQ